MYEIGNIIPRIIWSMAAAPENGVPILFTKIDLKDGYWRMIFNKDSSWNFAFAYILRTETEVTDNDVKLVIPHALQMEWLESPLFFCAATETARNVDNKYFSENKPMQPHQDEDIVVDI